MSFRRSGCGDLRGGGFRLRPVLGALIEMRLLLWPALHRPSCLVHVFHQTRVVLDPYLRVLILVVPFTVVSIFYSFCASCNPGGFMSSLHASKHHAVSSISL